MFWYIPCAEVKNIVPASKHQSVCSFLLTLETKPRLLTPPLAAVSLVFSEQPGNPWEKQSEYTSTILLSKEIISQRLIIKFGNLIELNVKFRIFRTWVVFHFCEKPYARLFCYFFVSSCTFFFIIYSYISDQFDLDHQFFLDYSLYTCIYVFSTRFLLVSTFL